MMNSWLENFAVTGLAAMAVALFTMSWQAIKVALSNRVEPPREE
ncbi:hypothetical protein [Parapedobacter sp. DT-150]